MVLVFRYVCILMLIAAAGCSGSGEPLVPTVPATGKLMVDGKPFGPATISLNSMTEGVPSASGLVKEDGTFVLGTYTTDDGVAEGEFTAELLSDPMATSMAPVVERQTITVKHSDSGPVSIELDFKATAKQDPAAIPEVPSGAPAL